MQSTDDAAVIGLPDLAPARDAGVGNGGDSELCDVEHTGHWCWDNPLPQGRTLRAVTAPSATEAWAVGDFGAALHWDGRAWRDEYTGSALSLRAVCRTAEGDVWAAANSRWSNEGRALLLRTASGWFEVPSPTTLGINAMASAGPHDLWAVGDRGAILHNDGAGWQVVPSHSGASLTALWVDTPADVWAVGEAGAVLRFDGKEWRAVESFTDLLLTAVWGSGPADVYAFASSPVFEQGPEVVIFHFDGVRWSETRPGIAPFNGVWGSGPGDIWAVSDFGVHHFDGRGWKTASAPGELFAIAGSGAGDLWAVGLDGVTLHGDGSQWASTWSRLTDADLLAAWAFSPDDVWAGGEHGTLVRFNGKSWTASMLPTRESIGWLWGRQPDDLWAVTPYGGEIYRWNGSLWSLSASGMVGSFSLWASSANDAWVAGAFGKTSHFDGQRWTTTQLQPQAVDSRWVWGSGASDVWLAGVHQIQHYDGKAWSPEPLVPAECCSRLAGDRAGNVYVTGIHGTIYRREAAGWSVLRTGFDAGLDQLTGSGPDDLWVMGSIEREYTDFEVILHWDGQSWSCKSVPASTVYFDGLAVGARGDVHLVGERGAILHACP